MLDATGAAPAQRLFARVDPDTAPSDLTDRNWDKNLSRRHHGLLYMMPITDLERNHGRMQDALSHYDVLAIVVKMFDLIVANTGLAEEMDSDRLIRHLSPLLARMDECAQIVPNPGQHRDMVMAVLDTLRNEKNGRSPHQQEHTAFDTDGTITRRALTFRLVEDRFRPDGQIVLRLSNQAVNIFLRSLDEDVEDAQAAAEALVESQIRRGKFEEAQVSAHNARYQSIRFQAKIMEILGKTRRDIRHVDWRREVPALLEDARIHTEMREAVETSIMAAAEERLTRLQPGSSDARNVAEVARIMRECYLRHAELLQNIRRARPIFMDEQGRQIFQPVSMRLQPSLISDVLRPLLRMPALEATVALDGAFPAFVGLATPGILDLDILIRWQLRPKRPPRSDSVMVADRERETVFADLLRYPVRVQFAGDSLLEAIEQPTRLSDLIVRLEHDDEERPLIEYVILRSYHLFAPEAEERLPIQARKIAGETLECRGHSGDDLLLIPLLRSATT